jgi:hypothetical protein
VAGIKKVALWIVGVSVAVCAVVLSCGFWWVSTWYQSEAADSAQAAAAFAEVRARFACVRPAFEIDGDRLVVMRQPAAEASSMPPGAACILVWQPRERILSRVTLPLWLSAVATEPLPLETLTGIGKQGFGSLMEAESRGNELNIRISDIERYGRTLLLDGVTADGKHVLMWNQ